MDEMLSRAELLRRGALGLTLLTVGSAMVGCKDDPRRVRDDKLREVDPKLIGYREVEPIDTGFHWPRGLACHDGEIAVAGDQSVRRMHRTGKMVVEIPLPSIARAVAFTPDGSLWAATDDQILRIGEKAWESMGPRARIISLAATAEHIYATDAADRCLLQFAHDGELVRKIEGFVVPSPYFGLAIHGEDALVSNPGRHRIERYPADRQPPAAIGKQGQEIEAFCGCCNPTNLAVLPNGDIVTAEKGLPRVKVIAPSGALKRVVAGPKSFDFDAAGLALAVDGRDVLVLDPQRSQVRRFREI